MPSKTDDFQRWLDECHSKLEKPRRLLEEIRLAMQLYDEAVPEDITTTTAEDIYKELCSPKDLDLSTLARWKGIHGEWFLSVFSEMPYTKRLIEFGCQLWFVRKVCIIVLLRRHQVSSGALVDSIDKLQARRNTETNKEPNKEPTKPPVSEKATSFLSYTGAHSFQHFVENVQEHLRDQYIWMDIFCVDQFAWSGQRKDDQQMTAFRKQLTASLESRIKEINHTVLMVDSWKDIMTTLEKTWVLWEIFNTATGKTPFNLLLSQNDKDDYLYALYGWGNNHESANEALRAIDVEKSVAADDNDRESILSLMRSRVGGLHDVNKMVSAKIRAWMIEEADKELHALGYSEFRFLDQQPDEGSIGAPLQQRKPPTCCYHGNIFEERELSQVYFLRSVGNMRLDHGSPAEAELLYRKAREICHAMEAHGFNRTNDSLHLCLMAQNKYAEAETVIREKLGFLREDSLDLKKHQQHLDQAMQAQGKPTNPEHRIASALSEYEEMLERPVRRYEPNQDVGELNLSPALADLARTTGVTVVKLSGPIQNDMALVKMEEASFLEEQGNFKEAEMIYRKVIGFKVNSGLEDANETVSMKQRLAELLIKQGEVDEAGNILISALMTLERMMGEAHDRSLTLRIRIAHFVRDTGRHETAEGILKQGLEHSLNKNDGMALEILDTLSLWIMEGDKDLHDGELFLRRAYELSSNKLGGDHPTTARRQFLFALCLFRLEKYIAAHSHLVHAREILPRNPDIETTLALTIACIRQNQVSANAAESSCCTIS